MMNQIQKFMVDVHCIGYTTLCVSDENEVFMWGKNLFAYSDNSHIQSDETIIREPSLVWRADEEALSVGEEQNSDIQMLDRVFGLKGIGLLVTSKTRIEEYS